MRFLITTGCDHSVSPLRRHMVVGLMLVIVAWHTAGLPGAVATERPVQLPPVKVSAPVFFTILIWRKGECRAELRVVEESNPQSLTLLKIPGARDKDHVISVNGDSVASLGPDEVNARIFRPAVPVRIEVRAPGETTSRTLISIRMAPNAPKTER